MGTLARRCIEEDLGWGEGLKSSEEGVDIRMAVEEAAGEAAGLDTGRSRYMVPGREEDIET